jgi:hypothetical protein
MGDKITAEDVNQSHALAAKLADHIVDAHVPRYVAYIALSIAVVNLMEEAYGIEVATVVCDKMREVFVEASSYRKV